MSKGEKPILSVRVDQKLLDKIDDICERSGAGRAEVVERCLYVGLSDEDEMLRWLETPITGELVHAITHPKIMAFLIKALGQGDGVNPNFVQIRENVKNRRRGGSAKPKSA